MFTQVNIKGESCPARLIDERGGFYNIAGVLRKFLLYYKSRWYLCNDCLESGKYLI